jgi:hypothetical protein
LSLRQPLPLSTRSLPNFGTAESDVQEPKADLSNRSKIARYSITSSAMAGTPGGLAKSSAFAVFMLMTNSIAAIEKAPAL